MVLRVLVCLVSSTWLNVCMFCVFVARNGAIELYAHQLTHCYQLNYRKIGMRYEVHYANF